MGNTELRMDATEASAKRWGLYPYAAVHLRPLHVVQPCVSERLRCTGRNLVRPVPA